MSARVEAATEAIADVNGAENVARLAITAADQIMFSEAAIERAAKALRAEFSVDDNVGEYDASAVWGTPADIARAVVAALREEA